MTNLGDWLDEENRTLGRAMLAAHRGRGAPDDVRRRSLQSARVALLGSGIIGVVGGGSLDAVASSGVGTSGAPVAPSAATAASGAGAPGGLGSVSLTPGSMAPGIAGSTAGGGALAVGGAAWLSTGVAKVTVASLLFASGVGLGGYSLVGDGFTDEASRTPAAVAVPIERTSVEGATRQVGDQPAPVAAPRAVVEPSAKMGESNGALALRPTGELPSLEKARGTSGPNAVRAEAARKALERAALERTAPIGRKGPGNVVSGQATHNDSPRERREVIAPAVGAGLTDELQLIQRARAALKRGETAAALAALELHAERHPNGVLTPEARQLHERAVTRPSPAGSRPR
jgi:hypothetical protein